MNRLEVKKINNENIKVIPVPKTNPSEIKGYNVIPKLYCNIYICGHKGSGKTNVIFKIIESCIDSDTRVVVFCSTHNNDSSWLFIKKYFEKNNIQSMFYTSLLENNTDNLQALLDFMREEAKLQKEEESKKEKVSDMIQIVKFDNNTKTTKIKIKKKKKQTPKYLFIFDDLSVELTKKNVSYLIKTQRHYQMKLIVASQFLNDLEPDTRQQIDFWLLFKNHPKERLEKLYADIGCNIDFEKFYQIYKDVTNENHQFLFVDKNTCEFRINFNQEIQLK